MRDPRQPDEEAPHDILAADEFAVGEGDRALHREEPHDVLAADAFPLPAPEPHAVPPHAVPPEPGTSSAPASQRSRRGLVGGLAALAAIVLVARRRRG